MGDADYFGSASVMDAMTAEHRFLWRALFRASGPLIRPGIRVLDFGCGNGGMLGYLMHGDGEHWPGCRCALAVGIDRPALNKALAEAAARLGGDLPVLFASGRPDAFPGQFDLILSHEVIYLLADLGETFRELRDSLRPGGRVVMATGCHNENNLYPRWMEALGRAGVHAHPYGIPDYVRALREAGFEEIETDRMRLTVDDYEEWRRVRRDPAPNPEWFVTPEEERRYYTEVGKALIMARRVRTGDPTGETRRESS